MAKPVEHDTASAVVTTGWETVKGGLLGALAVGGTVGVVTGAIASMIPVISGAAVLIGIGVGLISMFTVGGAAGAAIGAGTGLLGGVSRVSREKSAFEHKLSNHANRKLAELNNAQISGMQQGYAMGFQEGAQHVANEIQKLQYAAIQQEMARQQQANEQAPKGGFAAKEAQKREAQAAAGKQVG